MGFSKVKWQDEVAKEVEAQAVIFKVTHEKDSSRNISHGGKVFRLLRHAMAHETGQTPTYYVDVVAPKLSMWLTGPHQSPSEYSSNVRSAFLWCENIRIRINGLRDLDNPPILRPWPTGNTVQ